MALPTLEHELQTLSNADQVIQAHDGKGLAIAELNVALLELEGLLHESDMAALRKLDEIQVRHASTLGPLVNELATVVGALDFGAAIPLCEELRGKLNAGTRPLVP